MMDDRRASRRGWASVIRTLRLATLMVVGAAIGYVVGELINTEMGIRSGIFDLPLWVHRNSVAIFAGALCGLAAELVCRLFGNPNNVPWGFRTSELLIALTIVAVAITAFLAVRRI
jgi:hypothetical protein